MQCCLCAQVSLDNRRRKKLYGNSCSEARKSLIQLCAVPLNVIPEISFKDAVLCFHSEKRLKDIAVLEPKLLRLKTEVSQMISSLISRHSYSVITCHQPEDNLFVPPPPKRTSSDHSSQIPWLPSAAQFQQPTLASSTAQLQPPPSASSTAQLQPTQSASSTA